MPGQDISTRDGRTLRARNTSGSGGEAADGPVAVLVKAPVLEGVVIISDGVRSAYAVIGGDKADEVRARWEGGIWRLEWPEDAGVTVISGGVQFGNGNVQFNSFGGSVFAGRNVTVNGVRVGSGSMPAVETPTLQLYLPSGCTLMMDTQSGDLRVPAPVNERHGLTALNFSSQSGSVSADCAVGSLSAQTASGDVTASGVTGQVSASSMSGDVTIRQAAGTVQAKAMSGDVKVHAIEGVMVTASSMSGDVRVTQAQGVRAMVSASSMSGRVSKP